MGLGFASFFDPQSAGQTLLISQFFNLLAALLFLAVNAHLLLLGILTESFRSLPISPQPLSAAGFHSVATYGSVIFSVGLQLALPLIAILLMTNLADDQPGARHPHAVGPPAQYLCDRLSHYAGRGADCAGYHPALSCPPV